MMAHFVDLIRATGAALSDVHPLVNIDMIVDDSLPTITVVPTKPYHSYKFYWRPRSKKRNRNR